MRFLGRNGNRLTPVVGVGLAAIVATSLVTLSLLAQRIGVDTTLGAPVTPRSISSDPAAPIQLPGGGSGEQGGAPENSVAGLPPTSSGDAVLGTRFGRDPQPVANAASPPPFVPPTLPGGQPGNDNGNGNGNQPGNPPDKEPDDPPDNPPDNEPGDDDDNDFGRGDDVDGDEGDGGDGGSRPAFRPDDDTGDSDDVDDESSESDCEPHNNGNGQAYGHCKDKGPFEDDDPEDESSDRSQSDEQPAREEDGGDDESDDDGGEEDDSDDDSDGGSHPGKGHKSKHGSGNSHDD